MIDQLLKKLKELLKYIFGSLRLKVRSILRVKKFSNNN